MKPTTVKDSDGSNVVSASESTMSSLPGTEGEDDYYEESSGASESVYLSKYIPWLMEQELSESVSFAKV